MFWSGRRWRNLCAEEGMCLDQEEGGEVYTAEEGRCFDQEEGGEIFTLKKACVLTRKKVEKSLR